MPVEGLAYLAGAAVVLAVLAFVGWPLVRRQPVLDVPSAATDDPAAQRSRIYRELVELELDHRIGKLTRADFHEQSDALLARAAALIVAEDSQTHDVEEQVEREISAMREALRLTPSSTRAKDSTP
jgi:uncharacterized membrane protein YccC